MKRPSLAFGLVVFLTALLFFFMGNSPLVLLSLIAVAVLLFYFLTKNSKIKNLLIIPTIAISILISVASLHFNNFLVYEKAIKLESASSDIVATVVENQDNQYILKASIINGEEADIKIFFATEEKAYNIYDTVFIDDAKLIKTNFEKNASDKLFLRIKEYNASDKLGEKNKDFYYYALSLKYACENKLSEYLFNDSYGIASGMLFGGTSDLSDELTFNFRASGVAHLLAVSGLHTSLWCGLFITILKFLKLKEKYANLCGVFVLLLLVIISGFTPSVIRASFMMALTLIAPIFKKQSDSINSLGLAAGIILFFNPFVLYSPSFYLSFLATLGVVTASKYTYKINGLLARKNTPQIVKRVIQFIFDSILISVSATIFTLPASVYYFGTVSIIAPVTNLLTINLAFVSMVATLISLTVSFIPFEIFHSIAKICFTVTDYILKLLITIINTTGSAKYASISADESFVFIGIIITVSLLLIYIFILNKLKLKSIIRKLSVTAIILPLVLSLILSLVPFRQNTEFTILSNTNTPNIIIRTGTHYAVINTPEFFSSEAYKHLPKTKNDTIDLFAVTYLNKDLLKSIELVNESFNINSKMVTPFVNSILYNFNTASFNNAQVSGEFTYSLENEINIRIFDTYGKNCAIIEFNEKIVVLSFSEHNKLNEIKNDVGEIDVLVLPENIPDNFSTTAHTLIVCTNDESIHKNDYLGYIYANEFYKTSDENNITLRW
ncbi:MAG: ComEC/Rec2 family competence protein [Clostridia bacterium]|nr:ComEC/Rec2 family competence protein [Clostridia bacterium]